MTQYLQAMKSQSKRQGKRILINTLARCSSGVNDRESCRIRKLTQNPLFSLQSFLQFRVWEEQCQSRH